MMMSPPRLSGVFNLQMRLTTLAADLDADRMKLEDPCPLHLFHCMISSSLVVNPSPELPVSLRGRMKLTLEDLTTGCTSG